MRMKGHFPNYKTKYRIINKKSTIIVDDEVNMAL